jgi:multidrug efflux system outer membrane protein
MFNNKNMTKRVLSSILFLSFIGILSSCSVTKQYQAPEVNTDNLYRDVISTDTNTIAHLSWDEVFTDPVLQDLIQRGLTNNLDLLSAYTRIQQAQAYFDQSKAALLPSLSLGAGATSAPQYTLGASSAWELDIWGRLSSSKRAELANLLQTETAAKAVQTSLISSIANYYYRLLAMDQQLIITQQTILNWDTTVTTMKALKEAATVTEAAVVQSEAQRYAAEVTIPDLKQSIKETENALSILIGSVPGGIERGTLINQKTLSSLNAGIPAQLLANRPDVMQAELILRSQFELSNVARASFYPTLSITGSAGFSSDVLNTLLDPGSWLASISGSLTQPIFNRRANRTRLEVALAQQEDARLSFEKALLVAGQEVSNALSQYETANQKIGIRAKQTDALQKSADYSQELLENGFANYTEIITARQSLLQAQLSSVNDRLQQLTAIVNLYRSLGGGWK